MKKNLLSLLGLASVMSVSAQTPNANHKGYYTIPTVIHLLKTGSTDPANAFNLTDQNFIDGIQLMNDGLRGNLGRARINNIMYSNRDKIGGLDIELVLVNRTPQGAASTGIVTHTNALSSDANTNQRTLFNQYNWDPTKYLNLYVAEDTAGRQSGVAWRPDEVNQTGFCQGVLVHRWAWPTGDATTGNVWPSWGANDPNPFAYHNIAAHEVGHFLNLIHTWGSSNTGSSCTAAIGVATDDSCADTPRHSTPADGQVPNPTEANALKACNAATNVMIDNAMLYSKHPVMFTPNQITRMENALNSAAASRNTLWTNGNLIATGLKTANDDRYCYAKGKATTTVAGLKEWISNVTLTPTAGGAALINNTTVVPANVNAYYSSFTANTPNVFRNQTYTLSVTLNGIWNATNDYDFVATWIDWNNNGLFERSERYILRSAGAARNALTSNTATASITVPAGATINANTRMRVRSIYGGDDELQYVQPATSASTATNANVAKTDLAWDQAFSCTPCGEKLYGEVEDYALNVTNAPTLSTDRIESNSKDLVVVANKDALAVHYQGDDAIYAIEISDMAGHLVAHINSNSKAISADISNYAAGAYVARVIGEKAIYTQKFIKK
jgi:GEVED domain/Pregnancy-associated plasma protein-A